MEVEQFNFDAAILESTLTTNNIPLQRPKKKDKDEIKFYFKY